MAEPPILSLTDIRLGFGGAPLFDGVTLSVGDGDRVALVGRNGSGKSTLLKVMAGLIQADSGERFAQPGASIAWLPQAPDLSGFATLMDVAAADLSEEERYKAEIALEGLKLDGAIPAASASGGEQRRAALARALAGAPDLLLLDEPTNHLDIEAITWLEETLAASRAGFVLISHDRRFLGRLTRATLWLDRGRARRLDQGFSAFEDWRDKLFEEEEQERAKLDAKIRREEHWIIHGVSGRRKRNIRRVDELATLRERRRAMKGPAGAAAMALDSGSGSGKLVIEAEGVTKRYGERAVVDDFSIRVMRGDRIALAGPNGAGKTTLLRLLTGELQPDSGRLRLGSNLRLAVFDQNRAALDPAQSLWKSLTEDPDLGVKGHGDQVLVRGRPKHVVGYLKEFLFDEGQARGPVSALSGGEKARLLLARIMARESNLLALDEPTNDLDIETLDLLQELLDDYDGTLILVSHDRDFIDRIAATTIVMEGDGKAQEYAGGWSDAQAQRRPRQEPAPARKSAPAKPAPTARAKPPERKRKLSFNQARRLELLPGEMERISAEIAKLNALLAEPNLYSRAPDKFDQASRLLTDRQAKLAAAEEEWLTLETLREELEGED